MAVAPVAVAQQGFSIEEVIVTAQKRDESAQDVPISIDVLDESTLEDFAVTDLADFVQLLPSANYTSIGPGSGSIYIRGISGGGESALGSSPNVAIYLDEQPITAVNRYLNPHIYDIARIEALAGPQGTLFGANSQSGSIRLITNKPNPNEFEAQYDLELNSVSKGDQGYLLEGMVNVPLGSQAALRVVGWHKEDAGFIDNVPATHTFSNANVRAALTDPDLIARAADITVNNHDVAEKDFNEATTSGARALLGIDLSENWTVTAGVMRQDLESSGVWDHDPTDVGDLEVVRLLPDSYDDEWTQVSLVVEGEIAGMSVTYAGATLDRKTYSEVDYSLYSDFYISGGFVQRFYSCYVAYFGDCVDPREIATYDENFDRDNHELRIATPQDQRLRALVGAFYEESKHAFDWEWHVLGLVGLASAGTPAAVEPPDIYWTTDQVRDAEELAFFGELAFDLSDTITASASARYFDYEVSLRGFSGTVWFPNRFGPRVEDYNTDLVTADKDVVFRGNLAWDVSDNAMVYATYSEGYRPGGLNRVYNTVAGGSFEPDFVKSWEVGLKASAMEGRMRYNFAAFTMNWDNFQLSRLDNSISPLTLTYNIGQARSRGFEGDVAVLLSENWEVTAAFSIIDAELTEDYWVSSANFGNEALLTGRSGAPKGRPLPRVPSFKANLSSRYSFELGGRIAYVQGSYIHTGKSYNALLDTNPPVRARSIQHSYDVLDLSFGVDWETSSAELFVRNVTDERAEVFKNAASWDGRITTNRPRTIGLRWRQRI